ncbi:porin [Thiohalobacter thiocyanaticus]|uniref:Porin n=1 Tax=Thiohalobacter thiocyanaticus TaxID=585455 RepID=A0A426QL66_9GAMM|nr:porin [Thiohalobacter thiocyanaticus]RRQ22426.1 porin [Thiohalobacter thiocyanaticus]
MKRSTLALSIGALLAGGQTALAQDMPSAEEMWRIIQQQQKQIQELKARVEDTDMKADAAVEAVESGGGTGGGATWAETTQIGGYGELHYNNLDGSGGASDKDELDFHRFVLFVNHQFSDNIRLFTELEIEHALAGEGQPGEVELEQAYVEMDLNDYHRAKAGVFLLPVGILNETHEPNTFYGVERNPIEKNIIPTTWWAAGAGLSGELGQGFSYDLGVHEGLRITDATSFAVRGGRQKSAEADASDLAYTGRLKYTGMPGLELATTLQHQTDITQGSVANAGSANLFEAHGIYSKGPFGLRALYARWDLDGSGPETVGADEQFGWYIEPSFRLNEKWGLFARYNEWDNRAGNSSQSEMTQVDVGVNFWPHPDVVLKADYQMQDNDNGQDQDGFNLGVGYQF